MFDITPIISKDTKFVSAYGIGFYEISDEKIFSPVFLFKNFIHKLDIEDLSTEQNILSIEKMLDEYCSSGVDCESIILILGKGAFESKSLNNFCKKLYVKNIIVEIMDSSAACRTYNILVSEGRNVAAILFPPDHI